ncbi:MAG TPA: NgoPII family restriction endonuclease [Candidatus Paceibacterota bacterium]|nr:NgoPII family restriction endonuclease [Candidatus Paceibacterota bacterium]
MPATNILKALVNLSQELNFNLRTDIQGSNRITQIGMSLESFVKDAFCGSLAIEDLTEKVAAHREKLSYIGNANNPPDFIISAGDAVEVKKIERVNSPLALNSSYPKDKLYNDDPLITEACRQCEASWTVKDFMYAVGVVQGDNLSSLFFVQGDCYAADREVYQRTREKIISGVIQAEGTDFSETNELGRVNKVDPLGITYLRIRGMWGIENPRKVFERLNLISREDRPLIAALILRTKFDSFPEEDRQAITAKASRIEDIQIANPNNPAQTLDAKLIVL